MRIFKFGGASVKNASAVQNVERIISLYSADNLLIVVSAMGKTTNKLEELVNAFSKRDFSTYNKLHDELYKFHFQIIDELFPKKNHKLVQDI